MRNSLQREVGISIFGSYLWRLSISEIQAPRKHSLGPGKQQDVVDGLVESPKIKLVFRGVDT